MFDRRLLSAVTIAIMATTAALPAHAASKKTKTAAPAAQAATPAQAASVSDQNPNHVTIDLSAVGPTKNEVAMLQVISEMCPPMLNAKQRTNFAKAYNTELQNLMPTISEPKAAVQYLSTQADYQQILNDTRQWLLSYPKADNQQMCFELAESATGE